MNINARGLLLPMPEGVPKLDIGINSVQLGDDPNAGGTGYSVGDTLTTSGGAGNGVVVQVTVVDNGMVKEVIIIDPGQGFEPDDFFKSSDTPSYGAATVKLTEIETADDAATGLQAYVLNGIVISTTTEPIQAPKKVGELFNLSPRTTSPDQDAGIPEKAINEIKEEQVQITDKSSDNKYDVFFHYHNDVSHVYDTKWGFTPQVREQAIDLEISLE